MQQHSQATAREMLNEMIKESATKYHKEITKCTSFYASHCSFMEIARSQISAANYVATTSHALISDAQANIVRSEKDIPVTKKELVDHNRQFKHNLGKLNKWLKAVMGDIKVITMILKSTDCGAKKFLQLENSDEKHGGNPRLEPKRSRVGQGPHCIESALHTLEIAL